MSAQWCNLWLQVRSLCFPKGTGAWCKLQDQSKSYQISDTVHCKTSLPKCFVYGYVWLLVLIDHHLRRLLWWLTLTSVTRDFTWIRALWLTCLDYYSFVLEILFYFIFCLTVASDLPSLMALLGFFFCNRNKRAPWSVSGCCKVFSEPKMRSDAFKSLQCAVNFHPNEHGLLVNQHRASFPRSKVNWVESQRTCTGQRRSWESAGRGTFW